MDQELVQYLDTRFQSLEQQIDHRFDRVDQRLDRVEHRLDDHDQRFDRIDQRLDTHDLRFDEVKRHNGILIEGLRHELQLVAEGLAMHNQVQHVQEREYHDRQHQETRALLRSFHDETRQQHNQLRQRVENLERKDQN